MPEPDNMTGYLQQIKGPPLFLDIYLALFCIIYHFSSTLQGECLFEMNSEVSVVMCDQQMDGQPARQTDYLINPFWRLSQGN